MSFAARYPGRCANTDCHYSEHRIAIGDDIEYVDDEPMHTTCAARTRRGEPPLCNECFTQHRGECL